jgi:hypothetical protein
MKHTRDYCCDKLLCQPHITLQLHLLHRAAVWATNTTVASTTIVTLAASTTVTGCSHLNLPTPRSHTSYAKQSAVPCVLH